MWVKYCARERTGRLSNKKTQKGDFNVSQQGSQELGLGLGLAVRGLRFAVKKQEGHTLRREEDKKATLL